MHASVMEKRGPQKHHMPRIIWILWLQGWDKAPYIAQRVRESWQKHCPGWRIVALDERSLEEHAHLPRSTNGWHAQHRSELARLKLLSTFGGVWADATLLALRPLDTWLWKVLNPAGAFMYHGPGAGRWRKATSRFATVWFMAAANTSYMFQAWWRATAGVVAGGKEPSEYYMIDGLFEHLLRKDSGFRHDWARVPFSDCNRPLGGPHAIAGKRALRVLRKPPECLRSQRDMPHMLKRNA